MLCSNLGTYTLQPLRNNFSTSIVFDLVETRIILVKGLGPLKIFVSNKGKIKTEMFRSNVCEFTPTITFSVCPYLFPKYDFDEDKEDPKKEKVIPNFMTPPS
jgi:hypothetical protein